LHHGLVAGHPADPGQVRVLAPGLVVDQALVARAVEGCVGQAGARRAHVFVGVQVHGHPGIGPLGALNAAFHPHQQVASAIPVQVQFHAVVPLGEARLRMQGRCVGEGDAVVEIHEGGLVEFAVGPHPPGELGASLKQRTLKGQLHHGLTGLQRFTRGPVPQGGLGRGWLTGLGLVLSLGLLFQCRVADEDAQDVLRGHRGYAGVPGRQSRLGQAQGLLGGLQGRVRWACGRGCTAQQPATGQGNSGQQQEKSVYRMPAHPSPHHPTSLYKQKKARIPFLERR